MQAYRGIGERLVRLRPSVPRRCRQRRREIASVSRPVVERYLHGPGAGDPLQGERSRVRRACNRHRLAGRPVATGRRYPRRRTCYAIFPGDRVVGGRVRQNPSGVAQRAGIGKDIRPLPLDQRTVGLDAKDIIVGLRDKARSRMRIHRFRVAYEGEGAGAFVQLERIRYIVKRNPKGKG